MSAPGDFVFVKYTDAPVKLVIDNTEPVTITTGDKRRPARRFNSFLLENPHDRPIAVVLYVGEGDFDSQIIQGEVSVVPGVRGVDGQWRDDTRYSVSAFIEPLGDSATAYLPENPIYQSSAVPVVGDYITPGENLIAHAYRVSTSECRLQFFDSRCRLVRERSDLNLTWNSGISGMGNVSGGPADIAWHPRAGWLVLLSGNHTNPFQNAGIASVGPGAKIVRVDRGRPATSASACDTMCVGAGGLVYVVLRNATVVVYDPVSWDQVNEFKLPAPLAGGQGRLRWDADQEVFWFCKSGNELHKLSSTFQHIDMVDHPASTNMFNPQGFAVNGGYVWARTGSATGSHPLGVYPIYTVQRTVELSISQGSRACRDFSNMVWRAEDAPLIDADVTLARVGNSVLVTGEVIKAAIMAVTGRSVGDDYLDHVYAFEYSSGKAGLRSYIKQTGGRSFSAAGIADAFSVEFPAEVKLTIDDGLPLGSQFLTV